MRWLLQCVGVVLMMACTPPPVTPTLAPTMEPTAVPARAPAVVDYVAIRQPLLVPLGALIVATRAQQPTAAAWLTSFNQAAEQVLPQIEGDTSPNATRLRDAIQGIQAEPENLVALERYRGLLLEIR